MYAEKHYFQTRYTRWLQWSSAALALWQLAAFLGAETGLPWLPCGFTLHLLALLFALLLLLLLNNVGLSLRVSRQGWVMRSCPGQFYHRHIGWDEIKDVRLVKPGEWSKKGAAENLFSQAYLISNPAFELACLELTNGFQVFVSVEKPAELLAFLHHQILQPDIRKKVI